MSINQEGPFSRVWADIEQAMRARAKKIVGAQEARELSGEGLIRTMRSHRIIDDVTYRILTDLREMRNVRSHPAAGSRTLDLFSLTDDGLQTAQAILEQLNNPPTAAKLLRAAQTCAPGDRVTDVLPTMRANDFDMLPYRDGSEWHVFSRTHLALWVEAAAASAEDSDDTHVLLRQMTVGELTGETVTLRPVTISETTPLYKAVERLEEAIRKSAEGPASGVAPMLLSDVGGKPKVATPWDLPEAVRLLNPASR